MGGGELLPLKDMRWTALANFLPSHHASPTYSASAYMAAVMGSGADAVPPQQSQPPLPPGAMPKPTALSVPTLSEEQRTLLDVGSQGGRLPPPVLQVMHQYGLPAHGALSATIRQVSWRATDPRAKMRAR